VVKRRILFVLIFVGTIIAIGIGVRYLPSLSWVTEHERAFRAHVVEHPISSWCYGLLAYFAVSLVPGTTGKSVVCGWLFGFWGALAMVELGLLGAAVVSFLGSRHFSALYFSRQFANGQWRERFRSLQHHSNQDTAFYLLMLRMAHAPFTLVNYGAGATKIPLSVFCWTTLLGILPGTVVFTFVGARVPSLQLVAEHGVWTLVDLPLILALVVTAMLPVLLRYATRMLRRSG
jgi:uncharacterized membrane protein YdjX (TVP38/TMEM64 family)